MNFRSILRLFRMPACFSKAEEQAENGAIEQRIIARLARGNVSLQAGHYLTKQALSQRVQRLAKHKFI